MELDHLVILVQDLRAAVADYSELGFAVTPGGTHADGLTENALIPFADGTYLELIAFVDPGQPQLHRWWRYTTQGGGLIDYALHTPDLAGTVHGLAARSLAFDGPYDSGRVRPDGTRLEWRGAFAPETSGLPFLIEDRTARALRVPGQGSIEHPNGVRGITRVVIAANDVSSVAERYAALLDQRIGRASTDATGEAHTAHVALETTQLDFAQPLHNDGPLAQQLATRSSGIYAAWLVCDEALATMGWLNPQRTHNARLQVVLRGET